MSVDGQVIASELLGRLEKAWNAADGAEFAEAFAEDADFVNIRGEHFRMRVAIAKGHQGIFDSIYKGSIVHFQTIGVREIAPTVLLVHARSTLKAPTGPLAGEHNSLFTMVLVQNQNDWRIAAFHNTLIAK